VASVLGGEDIWHDVVTAVDVMLVALQMTSAVNQSQDYINLYEFGFNVFSKTPLCVI